VLAQTSAPVIATMLLGLALAGCADRSTGDESTSQTMTTADESTSSSTGEGSSSTEPVTTNSQEAVTYAAPSIEIDLAAMHGTGGTTGDGEDASTTGE
jgi:hypothetical protein